MTTHQADRPASSETTTQPGTPVPARDLKYIYLLHEPEALEISVSGGKAQSAAKLAHGKIPIPEGHLISRRVQDELFTDFGIQPLIEEQYRTLDTHNKPLTVIRSHRMMDAIMAAELRPEALQAIDLAHLRLGEFVEAAYRSTNGDEDGLNTAFPGKFDSKLFVPRERAPIAVKEVIASLHTDRVMGYRAKFGVNQTHGFMPVLVMRMIQTTMGGVMLTAHKVTGNTDQTYIEVAWGQAEGVVNGKVTPDVYVLDKATGRVVEHRRAKQRWMYGRVVLPDGRIDVGRIPVPAELVNANKLTPRQIHVLWHYALKIEALYGGIPMDTEFSFEKATAQQISSTAENVADEHTYYCTQARPITDMGEEGEEVNETAKVVVEGLLGSPGAVSGVAQIITDASKLNEFKEGGILVMPETDIRAEPQMGMAVAVITDIGGGASHAALTCAELGIPCVPGTGNATKTMKNGKTYTPDGTKGLVYKGEAFATLEAYAEEERRLDAKARTLKTLVEIACNIGNPKLAWGIAERYVDAVGLARAEFILTNKIKIHPRWFVETDNEEMFISAMVRAFGEICRAMGKRSVLARVLDPRVDEFKGLQLGLEYLPHNFNPAIGTHGARMAILDPKTFKMEMRAYAELAKLYPNFGLMGAFFSFNYELEEIAWAAAKEGLDFKDPKFMAAMMYETAANGIAPRDFLEVAVRCGYKYISFGGNDATQGVLEVDRMQTEIQGLFSQSHPTMLSYYTTGITEAHSFGMKVGFCGDGINKDERLFRHLIETGIDSVSPSPGMINKLRVDAANIEAELLGVSLDEYQADFNRLSAKLANQLGKKVRPQLLAAN